jgi:RHS repeat-associated protein
MVLVLLLLGATIGLTSALADDAAEEGASNAADPQSPVDGVEIPNLRTATSNTFRLPDGERETRLYEVPVNYRDEDGDWQPIEEGLEETPSGAIVNGENSFDIHLPEDIDEAPSRLSFGNEWISQQPMNIATEPADLQREVASYDSPPSEASFDYTGLSNGLKETIELARPSSPSTYHFQLHVSSGIVPELAENGSIQFRNASGEEVAQMPAPVMVDAAQVAAPPEAINYELEEDGVGAWTLHVVADPSWLAAADRAWPVAIDPTTEVKGTALECVILNDGAESPRCSPSQTYLVSKINYVSSGTDAIARSLFRFNLSTIPSTASVTSAKIGLYAGSEAKNVTRVDMYDVSHSWNEGVSWSYWDGHHSPNMKWTTPGGDYGKYMPTPTSISTGQRGNGPGWWDFSSSDLAWLVQRWITGAVPNNGVLVKLAEETPHTCCFERRIQWQGTGEQTKPYLSVAYLPKAPSENKLVSPTEGLTTPRRIKLKSAWSSATANPSGLRYQYRVGEVGGFQDIPLSLIRDANGNSPAAWPIATTESEQAAHASEPLFFDAAHASTELQQTGGTVQVRAVFSGSPGVEGYSQPVETRINRKAGGPKDATAEIGPGVLDLMTGNLAINQEDVNIPGPFSSLSISRSYSTREPGATGEVSILGQGWNLGVLPDDASSSPWLALFKYKITHEIEGQNYTFSYAVLVGEDGSEIGFGRVDGITGYIPPPELQGFSLMDSGSNGLALIDPSGTKTTFESSGTGSESEGIEYQPTAVEDGLHATKVYYETVGGKRRPSWIVAPAASGITCSEDKAKSEVGCRALKFNYLPASSWGAPAAYGDRLAKITYYAAGQGQGSWDVAAYNYDATGRLTEEWDPRVAALKEKYTYSSGKLTKVTPPGEEPWTLEYTTGTDGELGVGRLKQVSRPTLLASPTTAKTSIRYGVAVSGSAAPYDLSRAEAEKWGQRDFVVDATAIFPPSEVPAEPPASFAKATMYYMNAEGFEVNMATPSGAGTTAASISTAETDEYGNVVRELTAQNRLLALSAPTGETATRSHQLETRRVYSPDGTELLEERGPLHPIRLNSGSTVEGRFHKVVEYADPGGWTLWNPDPHLPTREIIGATIPGEGIDRDQRVTDYGYNWTLKKLTETVVDPTSVVPGGLNLRTQTLYDSVTGLPVVQSQPSDPERKKAGSVETTYYRKGTAGGVCEDSRYAGLPCLVIPVDQPKTAGAPELPWKEIKAYNQLSEPLEYSERLPSESSPVRTVSISYDAAGRPVMRDTEGAGAAIPPVETLYSSTNGRPTREKLVCTESAEACAGFDSQETVTTYDALGRVVAYQDADGNTASSTYDALGHIATFNDGKGTQTYHYDAATGLLTELEDSQVGTLTASYDADGRIYRKTYPNGLTAETSIDPAGTPSSLKYIKSASCGATCNWVSISYDSSVHGETIAEVSNIDSATYAYDPAGRLKSAQETPAGGACITTDYSYDKDSNRTATVTRPAGPGGACSSSGGTSSTLTYDDADRLVGPAMPTYDKLGRITALPAQYGGGQVLTSTYYANDVLASQTQGGITNSYGVDALMRHRSRNQANGLEGTEIFHYSENGDSPAWTERGNTWARSVVGIGQELVAVTSNDGSTTSTVFQLTNLHGDVIATASSNPAKEQLQGTFRFNAFGVPQGTAPGRYGWLGGARRPAELPSGVIQMGARSYVPTVGRFISPDPVPGGSASAYDYGNADPVNNFDLDGHRTALGKAQVVKRPVGRPAVGISPAVPVSAAPAPVSPLSSESSSDSDHTAEKILQFLKSEAGLVAPIAWGTCIPEEELFYDKQATSKAFGGRKCLPKLKYHVNRTTVAAISALKANGWAWCVVLNAWARWPERGWVGFEVASVVMGGFCSGNHGERPWAYLYFY